MIPRGLRIAKFPSFGQDNTDFKRKWEAILNKCSLYLILLLIEEVKKERTELHHHIEEVKQKLSAHASSTTGSGELIETEKKIQDGIDKLHKTLAQIKIDKFQQDYTEGKVYTWSRTSNRNRRSCSVSFSLPSSATASEDEAETSHPSTSSQSFLDNDRDTSHRRRRTRRRGMGDQGGRVSQGYHLRTRPRT